MKPLSGQLDLFGGRESARAQYESVVPCNGTVEPEDVPRLQAQHLAILDRLKEGPATNLKLSLISRRFSAQLGELRNAGAIHGWKKKRIAPGVWEYRLLDRKE